MGGRRREVRESRAEFEKPRVVHRLRKDAGDIFGVPEVAVVLELEEDALGVVVDAAQGEDLHLEELAELGLDLLLLLAGFKGFVQVFHGLSPDGVNGKPLGELSVSWQKCH